MIVVDNTVLTNFALIRRIDLLRQIIANRHPCMTPAVNSEFDEGVKRGLFSATDIQWVSLISLTPAELIRLSDLSGSLDDGEAESVVVTLHRGGLLASDDLKARKLVIQSGGQVTGTLGIPQRIG